VTHRFKRDEIDRLLAEKMRSFHVSALKEFSEEELFEIAEAGSRAVGYDRVSSGTVDAAARVTVDPMWRDVHPDFSSAVREAARVVRGRHI
jgi:hypothetical protein